MLPPIDLDELLDKKVVIQDLRGYDVSSSPSPFFFNGNGKRHRTPSPVRLKKIKRIGFDVFLSLKELVNNSANRIRAFPFRRYRKKPALINKRPAAVVIKNHMHEYEPSAGIRLLNSSPRRWNRVSQWHEYINDSGRVNKRDT
jgi:hypothetical protein